MEFETGAPMKKLAIIFLVVVMFTLIPSGAEAQEVSLVHQPYTADQLPFPGAPMTLSVLVNGTRDSQNLVRAILVRDGRLMDVPLQEINQDDQDRLVYSAQIHAP